jgi:hypothetical protein
MIFTIRQALKGASKATKATEQDDLEALITVDTKGSETRVKTGYLGDFSPLKSGDLLGMVAYNVNPRGVLLQ